ncbi:MAG: sugar ABC transporter permease [Lachnospiraceae bacterium]|nr:sugar ABC transporter permease [Lachnospiraceae bacterium]
MLSANKKGGWHQFVKHFKRDWQLYVIILVPVVYTLIFCYGPMYGIQIAFRSFSPRLGITKSPWVGLKWFQKFLSLPQFKDVFLNTLILSFYSLIVSFPLPIIFALELNALRSEKLKKFTQTVSYMPHFISTVVMVALVFQVLSPLNGIYGNVYHLFGGKGDPLDIRFQANTFRHLYVWSGVWQSLGWSSIIYMAALSGVSQDHHDAARVDGASRFQRILHVDLPAILPQAGILLILRCSGLISVGFEKVYMMQAPGGTNLKTAEVISTYVYKYGFNSWSNFSYGAAIGLFNTIINLVLLLTVNAITKRLSEKEISLF